NGPLLQAWFARTGHPHARDPYFLYGASNLGSFAVLLLYPTLIEPALTLREQAGVWSWGYGALVAGVAACGGVITLAGTRGAAEPARAVERSPAPRLGDRLRWLGLAFVPAALLVAVTAHISMDVAAAPFLWIAPLALFLLTFVLTFGAKPLVPPRAMLAT